MPDKPMNLPNEKLRKAAILIASVDHRTADSLLEQLGPAEAAMVLRQAVELTEIDPRERDAVLAEFAGNSKREDLPVYDEPAYRYGASAYDSDRYERPSTPQPYSIPQGEERLVPEHNPPGLDLSSSEVHYLRVPGSTFAEPAANLKENEKPATTFHFLQDANPETIAQYLACENPQAIAVVFSHLSPQQASSILEYLPKELQVEVIGRLTELDETNDEIVQEVRECLQTWLTEQSRLHRRRSAGISAVSQILERTEHFSRGELLVRLSKRDQDLANRLGWESTSAVSATDASNPTTAPRMFEEVMRLGEEALAEIFSSAPREIAILSLAGAEPEATERVLHALAPAAANHIRSSLENLGPTRLSDVDESQRQIVVRASQIFEKRTSSPAAASESSFLAIETN